MLDIFGIKTNCQKYFAIKTFAAIGISNNRLEYTDKVEQNKF
jgi:hypothetical protein